MVLYTELLLHTNPQDLHITLLGTDSWLLLRYGHGSRLTK